ncbi:glycoside hydrolase, partial [Aureobasidium melanogenum]
MWDNQALDRTCLKQMEDTPTFRIAIIGAGITGLTTAIALRRLPNVDVQIYERATQLRELGQAIAINPNGLRTLEELGLHKVLSDEVGYRCPSGIPQTLRHWKTNEVVGREQHTEHVEEKHKMTRFYRPHLQETILDYLPREIIHLNKRVVDVKIQNEGVDVEFEDTTAIHADLLVGADGIRSAVRGFFVPDFELKWSGLIAYRSAFDDKLLDHVQDLPEDTTQWWSSRDGILGTKMGRGKYGIVAFHNANPSRDQHLLEKIHWDETTNTATLRDMFKDFHPVVRDIVGAAPHVRTYPNFYGGFLDTYEFGGRVVLVGDAAHSHGGALAANASLGIDDAYCLYLSLLERVSSDGRLTLGAEELQQSLRLYDAVRRPHCEKVLKVTHGMYAMTNERLWGGGEEETDEQLREKLRTRPYAEWIHEYDVETAFRASCEPVHGLPETMQSSRIPHLRQTANSKQLIVKDEPFLMLAGELQNSSFSSPEYMKDVWTKLKAMNMNTVLGSVSWEQIEPTEGNFDFTALDQVLLDARGHDLHVVLLWFGSFKNGLSTYTPPWVKQYPKRFPRMKLQSTDGSLTIGDVLTIFGTEAQKADAKAFKTLMQHLKDFDEAHPTVIMVQVENEAGCLGDSRDRSELAEAAFASPLPDEFRDFLGRDWYGFTEAFRRNLGELRQYSLRKGMTWKDLPGSSKRIDELFMAYHYAKYLDQVAAVGKSIYPLPLYTNVWQNVIDSDTDSDTPPIAGGGLEPGDYPSGGGVVDVLDVWQAFAPSLDFIAPDIYLNDYATSCRLYRHNKQPLFIPEQRRDEYGALRIWTAFGSHACIGTSPFGCETVGPMLSPFRKHYGLLAKMKHHILTAQAQDNASIGFFFDDLAADGSDPSPKVTATFGDYNLLIERSFVFGRPSAGSGMIICTKDDNHFLLVGWGFQVTFKHKSPKAHFTGILRFEEIDIDDANTGAMRTVRLLNGDETQSGKFAIMPSEDPDYGGFPISVTVPARTGIAMCQPYALFEG